MIQGTLAVWSLVPLPFLNPAWTSGSSWFTYCWSLAWRFLSITLLTCESESHSVMSDSLWLHGLYSLWNSLGQNTGVGSLFLLQGIFPTQGCSPRLPHCRQILYQLSHKGSPRKREWLAYSFSSKSPQPRNQTRVSCIAGWFFTNWAMRENIIYMIFISGTSKNFFIDR